VINALQAWQRKTRGMRAAVMGTATNLARKRVITTEAPWVRAR
jgi:hypothetical protein